MTAKHTTIFSATNIIIIAVVATVAWLTIGPVAFLVFGSFWSTSPGQPGTLTLSHYAGVLFESELYRVLLATVVYAAGATAIAVLYGFILAFLVNMTNIPFKRVIEVLAILPFMIPMSLLAVGYVFMFSPRIGFINNYLVQMLNLSERPFNIYSMPGMMWVMGLFEAPLSFIIISSSLKSLDYSLVEGAKVSGAGTFKIVMQVIFPVLRPAILAVTLLNVIRSIEIFDVPAFLGIPANIWVMPTYVYKVITSGYATDVGKGSSIAVLFFLLSALLVVLYRHYTRQSYRFVTISQKGFRQSLLDLGRWRYPISAVVLLFLGFAVLLPIILIVIVSLMPVFRVPTLESLLSLTLEHYFRLFTYPGVDRAFYNTLIISFLGATLAMVLLSLTAYIVLRTKSRMNSLLEMLAFFPFSLPGMIIALGLIWFYVSFPIGLYGTIWLIMLAYITRFMPYGLRSVSSNLIQVDQDLENVAKVCGSSTPRTITSITLPLIRGGIVGGWLLLAVIFMRELSISILLSKTGSEVIPVILYDLYNYGFWSQLSALGVLLMIICVGLYVASMRFSRGTWAETV
ncbi:MAG: iron ABC transporter permease [Candidatus Caldarchaeum sp.]|nr:iron ABC transporter permease [Candidatus Caldarchaeum sp.]MDW8360230.1 iron ABC transporter permease [Candidatus Caldarchaeum sp.]